jgi:hypothetical protein
LLYATSQSSILGFTVDATTGALSAPPNTPGPNSVGIVSLSKLGVVYVSDTQNNQVDGFAVSKADGTLRVFRAHLFPCRW